VIEFSDNLGAEFAIGLILRVLFIGVLAGSLAVLLSSRPGLGLEDPRGHLMKVLALALDEKDFLYTIFNIEH